MQSMAKASEKLSIYTFIYIYIIYMYIYIIGAFFICSDHSFNKGKP